METVIATKADALILDLEASARTELKAEARRTVQSKRAWLATQTQRVFARINRRSRLYDFEDILRRRRAHVEGIASSTLRAGGCRLRDDETV
jgi:citrate lyase beta subunit